MILGVVLAGGKSTRFGSDKALATIGQQSLLELAIESLSRWCPAVVVAGREVAPVEVVADWPRAGCGPLGGIAAGLRYGQANGYSSILTCGVDSVGMPDDLYDQLQPAPAFLASQPVIGLWPVGAFEAVQSILAGTGRHSMKAFARSIAAREVISAHKPANINAPADLAALETDYEL